MRRSSSGVVVESLESRQLLAAIFSTNSVRRLYTEPIGGDASGSRVVRYKNVTSKSLTIPAGGVVVGGGQASEFKIISNFTLPRGLKPGASIKFSIVFDPPTGETAGIKTGLLTVLTTTGASKSVRLRGIATTGIGGANEPSLQRVLDLYQMPIKVGDSDSSTNQLDEPPLTPNDELDIQRFKKAGAGVVEAYPIAAYVQVVDPAIQFGWYKSGQTNTETELFHLDSTDAQSVNPNAIGSITFDPGSSTFGLYETFPGLGHMTFSEDSLNTWEPSSADRHKVRFYPLKNKDGTTTPNAYVMAFEDLAAPGVDYQDGIFLMFNVTPA